MAAGFPLRRDCLFLETFVAIDVNSLMFQLETGFGSTVIARWKVFSEDARYFMRLPVLRVVNDRINAGRIALVSRLKNVSDVCHIGPHIALRAGSWKNRIARAALP